MEVGVGREGGLLKLGFEPQTFLSQVFTAFSWKTNKVILALQESQTNADSGGQTQRHAFHSQTKTKKQQHQTTNAASDPDNSDTENNQEAQTRHQNICLSISHVHMVADKQFKHVFVQPGLMTRRVF